MKTPVSIVIPTHNRKESLLRSLKALERQTYPLELIEVIILADGCTDDTVEVLRETKTSFSLQIIEQGWKGAAAARNKGAEQASGIIFIFLDDDIEASPTLVEAHVRAHQEEFERVVVGYLPPIVYEKNPFSGPKIRAWWEAAFNALRHTSYRFNYKSLTSGNFSIKKEVFFRVNGFNTEFKCQEDYELGLRLILEGLQFHFEELAMGYHHEMTDLNKSMKRKYDEGKAALLFSRKYPAIIPSLPIMKYFGSDFQCNHKTTLFLLFHAPSIADAYAGYLRISLRLMERLRIRSRWQAYLDKLMNYYFLKGVAEEAGNATQLKQTLSVKPDNSDKPGCELTVDIKKGLTYYEQKIDEQRPSSIAVFFGTQYIGTLPYQYGFERWRGAHLRAALSKTFSFEIMTAIALDGLQGKKSVNSEKIQLTKENMYAYESIGSGVDGSN